MMNTLKLTLEQDEYSALIKLAVTELRNPVDQARFVLRQELERRGLLHPAEQQPIVKVLPEGGNNDGN